MQIEQGIATQRLRLFRLVTALLMTLAFVSAAPFSSDCRRWVCRAVLPILSRAELAAQYLVMAQARVLAARRGVCVKAADLYAALSHRPFAPDDTPSLASLQRRLKALRGVLKELPRRGLRLLRRVLGNGGRRCGACFAVYSLQRLCALPKRADPIERPPDKGAAFGFSLVRSVTSLPKTGGRRWRLASRALGLWLRRKPAVTGFHLR